MTAMSRGTSIVVAAALALLPNATTAAEQQPSIPSRPVASTTDPIAAYVAEASQRFGIPEAWIRAVMRVESAGEVGVTSSAGAMGLMQVMPQTYATLRARLGLGADAYDPHDNIMAGAAFLRDMHDRYGDAGFLAAYNAGPARYEEFRAGGRALPSETIFYMARLGPMLGVMADSLLTAAAPGAIATPEAAPIFVSIHGDVASINSRRDRPRTVQLAAADVQTDERSSGLFSSRRALPERRPDTDGHASPAAPTMQSSSAVLALPEQPNDQQDGLFVPRGAGQATR